MKLVNEIRASSEPRAKIPDLTDLDLCPGVDLFSCDDKEPDLSFMDNFPDIACNKS